MSSQNSVNNGHKVFYGRGGAGNAHKEAAAASPQDLDTPTVKGDMYTTGRGGRGNMVKNDPRHPNIARLRQDLNARAASLVVGMNFPIGRGGAGNIHNLTQSEIARSAVVQ